MRSTAHRRRRGFRTVQRTSVERLEGRTLLSTVVVNTTADSTDAAGSKTVSLRDAVAVANKATSATTITFSPTFFAAAKTITLAAANGPLTFSNARAATTITGPAAGVSISGNNAVQDVSVDGGVAVTLADLTVTKGNAGLGAGIQTDGTLVVRDSTLAGNDATSDDDGGGVAIVAGTATFVDDTIADNTGDGMNPRGGTVVIDDCTITGNHSYGGYPAGGIYNQGATVTIANTIVAGNTEAVTSGSPDVFGPFVSKGHNLVGAIDPNSSGWTPADLTGTDAKPLAAKLGALANNGGPTQTALPQTGSAALGAGSTSLVPSGTTTDQRGLPRTANGKVDVGAVEVQPTLAVTAPANQSAVAGKAATVALGSFTQTTNASPYKDAVNWGDGSTTTLSLTAAGTIPATAHTFAKAGTFTVTETVTDAKGDKSNAATFTVAVAAPVGSISGTVFDDANGDGKLDDGELGLGLWTVYLDLNHDGKLDAGDPSVTTAVNGTWSFAGLAAGAYTVRVVPAAGTAATRPTGNVLTITLAAGQNSVDNLFGERAA